MKVILFSLGGDHEVFRWKKKSNKQQGGPSTHSVHRVLESKFQKLLQKINHLKSQEKTVSPEKLNELQAEFNELKQGVGSYLQDYLLGLPRCFRIFKS